MVAGGLLIALVGALRHWRGVNATISSLLLTYVVFGVFKYLVEGRCKDPASTNKPSTPPIGDGAAIARAVRHGRSLGSGLRRRRLSARLCADGPHDLRLRGADGRRQRAGGPGAGLPVGRLILITCFLAGAAAGLAGAVEIAAVHKQANAALYRRTTASPASWSPSSPAINRWPSSRRRCCSAA